MKKPKRDRRQVIETKAFLRKAITEYFKSRCFSPSEMALIWILYKSLKASAPEKGDLRHAESLAFLNVYNYGMLNSEIEKPRYNQLCTELYKERE